MSEHAAKSVIKTYFILGPVPLVMDFAGPSEVLRRVNMTQDKVFFDVEFVGLHNEIQTSIGLPLTNIKALPEKLDDDAMVIISGGASQMLGPEEQPAEALLAAENRQISNWLKTHIRPSHSLVTICNGALLAAEAGLFNNHYCTTHHDSLEALTSVHPSIKVEENRLFTEDRNRYASAGITSGTDLMLHIIGQRLGPAIAAETAKFMVVYARRNGNDPQISPWLQGREHLHPAIHRIQDLIAQNPTKDWDVIALAKQANMSARHFSRLFNSQTGLSIPDYVNGLRVAIAENALRAQKVQIEQLVGDLGFGSSRQFRRAWGRHHALTPLQWRQHQATSNARQSV